jgi:predicted nuclease of predicted toxin-antitoxin system
VRFLADECCPALIVAALRRATHDVEYVLENSSGIADADAAAIAEAQGRILITEDFDFGELVVRRGVRLPGLVMLSFGNQPISIRVRRTTETVDRLSERLHGQITIIELNRERVRPLPAS